MPGLNSRAILGGLGLYLGAAGSTYLCLRSRRPGSGLPSDGADREASYDRLADTYDEQIGMDEALMGIGLLRWWVIRQARGSTLEVSAGTGRNLPYYRYGDLSSLTLMDSSANMLERAYDKLQKIPEARGLNVLLCQGNAESLCECSHAADGPMNGTRGCNIVPCPSPLPGGKYDTVIDTFGLCSHEDPVQVLKEMARCCKPGGNILLIEHGRADWEWLNSLLDRDAEKHFTRWGCWWNRDILGLVGKAGLKVNSTQRWHFGTTYVIHATTPDANDAT